MPEPIDAKVARSWKAWRRGPAELVLKCQGNRLARLAHAVHCHWPFQRGLTRYVALLNATHKFSEVPFTSSGGVKLWLDMGSSDFLYLSGRLPSEPLEVALMARLVRSGDVFIDVGAHRGLFAAHVSGRLGAGGRYHAFEPSPRNSAFIARAFRDNANVQVHPIALSDKGNTAFLIRDGWLDAHLISDGNAGTPVRVARLDDVLMEEPRDRPWVMKIDVEGAESAVIRGGTGLWEAGIRPIMLLELLPNIPTNEQEEVEALLQRTFEKSYRWFAVCHTHGSVHPLQAADRLWHQFYNVLGIPDEHENRLAAAVVASTT